ncbi:MULTISPECIES: lipopolysaccharide biosynthesis protein [Actinomyces]|uniref:Lipopolysaccharide biosynthesis protein n=1 Tax=Actinomyces viscosus TaxID=1656 RepID=A0ABT7U0G3_ACTVI|nr:lipopolysaccharide biosynthesis protein [Actinomyces viscosus]MDM8077573.1 lipopolysaccharide biosynthesis protein [Actinomyces viscosus]
MAASNKGRIAFLLGNTLVFALGGLAVKAVSLVLMPLYTTALTAGEYGTAELLNSAIEIVLPLLSAGVVEALYRFSIDDDVPKDELFANSLLVLGGGGLCTGVLCALGSVLWNMEHAGSFFVLFCSVCLFKATTQLARGLGHVRRFVAYGLINALAMVVSTYLLLVRARLGVEGYLWSFAIGYLMGGLAAFLGSAEYRLLAPFRLDRALLRRMLVYSLPLVPNLLSWWLVSVSGRYVVLWGSGVVAAGLFTAASKMPALVNIVASVFQQAWQYSTAREIDSPDRGAFFGVVMRGYSLATLTVAGLVIALNRPISRVMLQSEFAEGWRYVPLLMLVASFGVISIFFESFYQALKNSGVLMASTALGAVVNVILGVALVPFMGPWGAGLAGAVAYMLVLVVRARDLGRRINLPIDRLRLGYQLALLISITACMSFDGGSWLTAVVWVCLGLLATSDITVLTNSARAVTESLRRRSGALLRRL